MKTDFDDLFRLFVSHDPMRPYMQLPNDYDEYVCATDAHVMLVVPKPLLEEPCTYGRHPKAPNVQAVLDSIKPKPFPITITTEHLLSVLGKVEKEPDTTDCSECEGAGYKECPCCGHEEKCSECNGAGTFPDYTKPEVYPYGREHIRIGEAVFNPAIIGRLEAVVKFLDAKECVWDGGSGEVKPHRFRVGEVTVVLMPVMEDKAQYVLV